MENDQLETRLIGLELALQEIKDKLEAVVPTAAAMRTTFCNWCHNYFTREEFIKHFQDCLDRDMENFRMKVLLETGIDLNKKEIT